MTIKVSQSLCPFTREQTHDRLLVRVCVGATLIWASNFERKGLPELAIDSGCQTFKMWRNERWHSDDPVMTQWWHSDHTVTFTWHSHDIHMTLEAFRVRHSLKTRGRKAGETRGLVAGRAALAKRHRGAMSKTSSIQRISREYPENSRATCDATKK